MEDDPARAGSVHEALPRQLYLEYCRLDLGDGLSKERSPPFEMAQLHDLERNVRDDSECAVKETVEVAWYVTSLRDTIPSIFIHPVGLTLTAQGSICAALGRSFPCWASTISSASVASLQPAYSPLGCYRRSKK